MADDGRVVFTNPAMRVLQMIVRVLMLDFDAKPPQVRRSVYDMAERLRRDYGDRAHEGLYDERVDCYRNNEDTEEFWALVAQQLNDRQNFPAMPLTIIEDAGQGWPPVERRPPDLAGPGWRKPRWWQKWGGGSR